MDDLEHEQAHDDLEAKITPIPASDETAPSEHLDHSSRKPRFSSRRLNLILRVSVIINLILLALLVIPGSLPTLGHLFTSLGPASTPTLAPGAGNFYLDVNVPWTKVFIDGHLVGIPRISSEPPITLAPGRHLVEWRADPFSPKSCVLTVPYSIYDTCQIADEKIGNPNSKFYAQLVFLRNSLDALSQYQQGMLLTAIQTSLKEHSPRETVRSGELYRNLKGYSTATQPLQAILHFQMAIEVIGGERYIITIQGCNALCSLPWQIRQPLSTSPSDVKWLALILVSTTWDYAAEDGHIVDRYQPAGTGGFSEDTSPILLGISWDSPRAVIFRPPTNFVLAPLRRSERSWDIEAVFSPHLGPSIPVGDTLLADDPACVGMQNLLSGIAPSASRVRFASGSNPAAGCLAVVPTTSTTSTSADAYYLERFGVLLAANDVAHKLRPQLPLADAYERNLAQQMAIMPGQTITTP